LHRYGADLTIGFNYGQPHAIELQYAKALAHKYQVPFELVAIPYLPRVDDVVFSGRNAVMLAIGAAIAQQRGLKRVIIGCNFSDAQRFPDCRPEFIRNVSKAFSAAYGVEVHAPLLTSTKAMIAQEVRAIGLDTWTCYAPNKDQQCGKCYSCLALGTPEPPKDSETYGYCDIVHTSIGEPRK
jgi:7-cyano-7-deazaguanine synthase in queuosine biosynthesis